MGHVPPNSNDKEQKGTVVSDLSPLARLKLMLISYGVDIDLEGLRNKYGSYLVGCKTKSSHLAPKLKNGRIVEISDTTDYRIPSEIAVSLNGRESIVKVVFNPKSPYLLTADSEKCFILRKNSNTLICEVRLCMEEEALKSEICGYPLSDFLAIIGKDRLSVLLYIGCQNWLTGNQCKFCNLFALSRSQNKIVPNVCDVYEKFSGNLDEWWESVKTNYYRCLKESLRRIMLSAKLAPHIHLCFMAGNVHDISFQWKIAIELGEAISGVVRLSECDSYLNIMPTTNVEMLEKARQAGFKKVQLNLEVFGRDTYRKICPGKARTISYDDFKNSLKSSASVFGAGNARTNIVFGIQPLSDVKKGVVELAHYGVATDYTIFVPKRGTALWDIHSPSIVDVADFTIFLAKVYREFDFKPIYCSLSSRSSVINEQFYN
jgi:hypothetical protein